MSEKNSPPQPRSRLRIVAGSDLQVGPDEREPWAQMGLFPRADRHVASFFHVAYFNAFNLMAVAREIKPALLFDVRNSPNFRVFDLDRRKVLSELVDMGSEYVDVPGLIGGRAMTEFYTGRHEVIGLVDGYIKSFDQRPFSLMFIYDDLNEMDRCVRGLSPLLSERSGVNFEVEVFVGSRSWAK